MNKVRIIDTHTHYTHRYFDGDEKKNKKSRNEILRHLTEYDIYAVIEAAIGFESNQRMLKLCKEHSNVYAAVGVHPNCVETFTEAQFEAVRGMLQENKVLAIGETGLDYAGKKDSGNFEIQKKWFRRFIKLALETKMPLVIHCREAEDDLVGILSEYKERFGEYSGIVHCFSGEEEHAKKLIEMGFFLGIGGKFQNNSKTVKEIPLDAIVLETDCPYLLPTGLTEKPNTSFNIPYIVKQLAELKEVDEQEILEAAVKNTIKLYPVFGKLLI